MKNTLCASLLVLGIHSVAFAAPVELTISCGSVGVDFEICHEQTQKWAAKTGNAVKLWTTSDSSTDVLASFREQSESRSSEVDIMMVDVVWTGVLKDHLLDLKPYSKNAEQQHFPSIITNNTVDGKLLAMPWFTDAGLLYYRKDLLEKHHLPVPTTWEEMSSTAKTIQTAERAQGKKSMWGYVFQGKQYEGLTCDATEWVASYKGGNFIERDGTVSINNPKAAQALDQAASWIGTISPKSMLNAGEEEARAVFQKGNAVFMRNWPYAFNLAQMDDSKIKDKIGAVALPKGGADGQNAASLGGWSLAVSKYSPHPKEAADLALFLTDGKSQKYRAVAGIYNPTIHALYQDKQVIEALPMAEQLLPIFQNSVSRPSTITGERYNQVSEVIWRNTHAVLSGKIKGAKAVEKMEREINQIMSD